MKKIFPVVLLAVILMCFVSEAFAGESARIIRPVFSTTITEERTADDPAIWIDSRDPSRSVIIGTDKDYGFEVWNMKGELIQKLPMGTNVNNVDLRYGFKLGGKEVAVVAGNLRNEAKLAVFVVNPDYTNGDVLKQIAGTKTSNNNITKDSYAFALYRRPSDGSLYVFDRGKTKEGPLNQYLIEDDGTGKGIKTTLVRSLNYTGGIAEGCVVDDEAGFLYLSEEDKCVHKFYADPDKSGDEISSFAYGDGVKSDREGLALYKCSDGIGYLLLSSQGNATIKIYEREGDNKFIGTVDPVDSRGITDMETDGVDVTSTPILPMFPEGFMILHSDPRAQFAIYDWRDVSGGLLKSCK